MCSHDLHSSRPRKGGCWRLLTCGCAVIGGLAALAVILVALNFDRIRSSEWFQQGKEAIESLWTLRTELVERYPADNVEVHIQRISGKTALELSFTNPHFLEDPDQGRDESLDESEVAREIARHAARVYPQAADLDSIAVEYKSEVRIGVRVSQSRSYRFPISELVDGVELPEEAELPDERERLQRELQEDTELPVEAPPEVGGTPGNDVEEPGSDPSGE